MSLALALIILQAWCRWATRRGWRGRWRCPLWSAPPFLSGPLRCRPRDDENSLNHQTVVQIFKMILYLDNTSDPLCRMGASFLRRVGAKQRWRIFVQIIIFKKESKLHNIHYTLYLQSNTLDKIQQHLKAGLGNKMGNRASGSRKVGFAATHGKVHHLHHLWESISYFGKSQFKLLFNFPSTQEIFIDCERAYSKLEFGYSIRKIFIKTNIEC